MLTKRGKHLGQDIPMCGVPVHAADDICEADCARLPRRRLRAGRGPGRAKKRGSKSVVKRDVVRLVTPGTITEEAAVARRVEFLMALGRVKGGVENSYALAWTEIATGAFRVAETSAERLLSDVLRVDPRELIVADSVFYDEELKATFDVLGRVANPQPAQLFASTAAASRVARFYGIATPDSFGSFSRAELSAISATIAYVEKTQIAERPPLDFPEREENVATLSSTRRRAPISVDAHAVGQRDGSCSARSTAGDRRRGRADRLTAPLTDPRRSTGGSIRFPSSSPRRDCARRCGCH